MTSCVLSYSTLKKRLLKNFRKLSCAKDQEPKLESKLSEVQTKRVTVKQIQELIILREFHNASKDLILLEYDMYESTNNNSVEDGHKIQQELTLLYNELGKEVSEVIHGSIGVLSSHAGNDSEAVSEIREAVSALVDQVREDDKCASETAVLKRRPKNWKNKWEKVVKQSVDTRMKEMRKTSDQNGSSFSKELEHMGKTMKLDLIAVVNHIKSFYPEDFNVCNVYARNYHEYFSSQLNAITDFELGDKDTRRLLVWVHAIYPNEIMKHPDLVGNVTWDELGPLLPPEKIFELERHYVSSVEATVEATLKTSLQMEVKFWNEEKEPTILNHVYHTELVIDTIQVLNGQIEGAEKVSPKLAKLLTPLLVDALAQFLKSYRRKFEEFTKENKKHPYFMPIVIANVNSCEKYRDYMKSLATRQLADAATAKVCDVLSDIEKLGSDVLLQDLFLELEPNFKKLSQRNGLSHGAMIEIIKISEAYIPRLKTLKGCYYQKIMDNIHLHLVKEYITRLMKKKVSQKTPEQQKAMGKQIFENATLIKESCMRHGSQAKWLNDAIPKLAEIVKLQDLDAIRIVLASLVYQYPDISKNQITSFLYIKGNLKSSEVKSILSILDIQETQDLESPKLFSYVMVS